MLATPQEKVARLLDIAQDTGSARFVRDRNQLKQSAKIHAKGRQVELSVKHMAGARLGCTFHVRTTKERDALMTVLAEALK